MSANKSKATASSSTLHHPKRAKTESKVKDESFQRDSSPFDSDPARPNKSIPPPNDRSRTRIRDGRSLSTSPPTDPPPVEFMRPGLDEDDIYMLVEDEFQTIAQSYTGHLHRAEYKRLMRLAREKKAEQERAGTDLLGGRRIPDNVSGETKQRLRRELLKERQSSELKSMWGVGVLNGSDEGESDEEAREAVLAREEKKVGDMWAGTALSGLMSWNHSQEKMSLRGLEKISGETRASKGFGPSRKRDEVLEAEEVVITREKQGKVKEEQERTQPIERNGTTRSITMNPTRDRGYVGDKAPSTTSYANPTIKRSDSSTNSTFTTKYGAENIKTEAKEIKVESKPAKTVRSKYRSFVDSLDDFDEAAFEASQAAEKNASAEKPRSRNVSGSDRERRKRDRKDRLDEVPIFL